MAAGPHRHRSDRRARTPLDDARAAAVRAAAVGRRYGMALASSGLLVGASVPASATLPGDHAADAPQTVDVAALTAQAREVVTTSPVVSVPAGAAWGFTSPVIAVTANPKPPPVARAATTSRSGRSTAVPASVAGNAVLEVAARYVGVPYVYGGSTPDGFDCSGFTSYVFAQLGISLPRSSGDQRYAGVEVPADQAQPGDLVWHPGHVAIYAGGTTIVDSPEPGKTVQFREMYRSDPTFIRVTG